jgi:hypothetical protein
MRKLAWRLVYLCLCFSAIWILRIPLPGRSNSSKGFARPDWVGRKLRSRIGTFGANSTVDSLRNLIAQFRAAGRIGT